MITIKQLEELIHNKDEIKTIKYVDENKKPIEPNKDSIVEDINFIKEVKGERFDGTYKTDYVITIKNETNLKTI